MDDTNGGIAAIVAHPKKGPYPFFDEKGYGPFFANVTMLPLHPWKEAL